MGYTNVHDSLKNIVKKNKIIAKNHVLHLTVYSLFAYNANNNINIFIYSRKNIKT